MDIVIDSNIFISDFTLKSSNWEVLLDFVSKTESKIVIPQIIFDEINAEYERVFNELNTEHDKIAKKLHRHCPSYEINSVSKYKIDKYVDFLSERLKIEAFPYINDFLPEICYRAVNRLKPAKKDGKDFRDILIWLSIKSICKNSPHKQIIFISQNTVDFANDNGTLDNDLLLECTTEEICVQYYTSIGSFISEFVNQYSTKLNTYDKDWLEENLNFKEIEDQLKDMLNDEEWGDYFEYATGERIHADYYNIKYIEPIDILQYSGYLLPNGDAILNVDMKGDVYVESQYVDRSRDKIYEGNTFNGGTVEFDITIKISNGIIIDTYVNDNYCI
ncbi:PIN domain-containing protein [Petrimonas sulfuriphila]|uniref:PIN domain-containing protein n=1 Tax=Petrimonas sulfuriphila TaxID=285070 RepID=UPI003EBCE56B